MKDHPIYKDENVLKGSFIKAWKLIKRGTVLENTHSMIKITEIKRIMVENGQWCSFYTYKDCRFVTNIAEDELVKAINTCFFQPDEYCEAYGY